MSTTHNVGTIPVKLEVVVIPVSDVDRAKAFYSSLGWRLDADFKQPNSDFRVLQFTPTASPCSVIFGQGASEAAPGSAQGLHLIVSDVEAARADLVARGIAVSDVFHDADGVFHRGGETGRVKGPDPQRRSYCSFASFRDPDGNEWVFQEVTARLPGRIDGHTAQFASAADLESAMRRASIAHGEHEKRIGRRDDDWPVWYAEYMIREQLGDPTPT